MIHQPLSVVSQCGAGIWLAPGGDQRRLTGSGSALEAITRNALYNPRLLTLLCWLQCVSFKAVTAEHLISAIAKKVVTHYSSLW